MSRTNDMRIEPAGWINGTYRVFSPYDKESIVITAQGLLDLATWTCEHREQLEVEARKTNMANIEMCLRTERVTSSE